MSTQKISRAINIALWITQIILSILLLMGAVIKFMPIEKVSAMMTWTGQVSSILVRILGIVDFFGGLGLILPGILDRKPQLVFWSAIGTIALMISAMIFHISRGEASVIGFNILCLILAVFIAWGRRIHS